MARNENEDVSHLNLPDPVVVQTQYYMENGNILDDKQLEDVIKEHRKIYKKLPIVCAKNIYNESTDIRTFFVLCAGSLLFDPRDKDSRYRSRHHWKLRRVPKSVYDLYIRFLKTHYKSFLYQAERGL